MNDLEFLKADDFLLNIAIMVAQFDVIDPNYAQAAFNRVRQNIADGRAHRQALLRMLSTV